MLTGQAKTDYQREYMRKRRSNKKYAGLDNVRPTATPNVRPKLGQVARPSVPEPQSYNSMMVGYVPPTE